jgi:mono/diheme cytochrome c family protein
MNRKILGSLTASACVYLAVQMTGCREAVVSKQAAFEPNLVYAYQMGQQSDQPFDEPLAQVTRAMDDLFGTPDEPKLPELITGDEDLVSLLDMANLMKASGPIDAEGRGLYRKHCASCHGVTGNGRGVMAAQVNPYPRDYRMGIFKFTSTPIGTKPLKEDLAYVIRNGITGSSMVKIPELTEEDIDALVDYVIFLSIRGEVERGMLYLASDLDFTDPEEPESIYVPELAQSQDEDDLETWEYQQEDLADTVTRVVGNWVDAADSALEVPERDKELVPDDIALLRDAVQLAGSPIHESVERGRTLFLGEKTACSKCHGKAGRGDGQQVDYDVWTKEWTAKFGIDPTDVDAHTPLIARGALPVRQAAPRNFHEGLFRGGDTPEKLYQRIALGIDGTPMPAAAVEADDIWDIVNFVRSLIEPKDAAMQATEEETPQDDSSSVASL